MQAQLLKRKLQVFLNSKDELDFCACAFDHENLLSRCAVAFSGGADASLEQSGECKHQ